MESSKYSEFRKPFVCVFPDGWDPRSNKRKKPTFRHWKLGPNRSCNTFYDIFTWNPSDPCFDWKGPCFGGLTFKNRGHLGSRYIENMGKYRDVCDEERWTPIAQRTNMFMNEQSHNLRLMWSNCEYQVVYISHLWFSVLLIVAFQPHNLQHCCHNIQYTKVFAQDS